MVKIGWVDLVEDGVIRGWALDEGSQSPAVVDILIDDVVIAKVACSELRLDLVKAKRGTGWHGFTYPVPMKYMRSCGKLSVRFSGGGPLLNQGQCVLPDFTDRFLASSALSASALGKGLWCIDQVHLSETEVEVEGWCIPPGALPVPVVFTHNGEALVDLVRSPRMDIAKLLDMAGDVIGFGFRARGPLSTASRRHDFHFEHAYTRQPFDANQSIHFISSERPLPPEELRMRVHGSGDAMSFVKEGSTAYVQMERVLENYFAKSFEDFHGILDWGCGSGRMLRYFSGGVLQNLTGIDIDLHAIEWCRHAFPESKFLSLATEPPTPLASDTFDLIYGNSVLTHLREKDHLKWLGELQRLAKPGAVLLLTTAGERNWWGRKFRSSQFGEWKVERNGFFEGGLNTNLDEIGLGDYYRNVFISPDYIWRNWSRYFEIIDFIPGGIGSFQDLTILRKQG